MVFVASGVIASIVGYDYFDKKDYVMVWQAKTTLPAGTAIKRTMLEEVVLTTPLKHSYLTDITQIEGRIVRSIIESGAVISEQHFAIAPTSRQKLSDVIPSGRVVISLTQSSPSLPLNQLTTGDWLDVVVMTRNGPQVVAQGAMLVGFMKHNGSKGSSSTGRLPTSTTGFDSHQTTLLLAVSPREVYALSALGTTSKFSLILRAKDDVRTGQLPSLHSTQITRSIEIVTNNDRRTVNIEQ